MKQITSALTEQDTPDPPASRQAVRFFFILAATAYGIVKSDAEITQP